MMLRTKPKSVTGRLRELRTMLWDPLFSPLSSSPEQPETTEEAEGAPHSVARSARSANTYWRHYRDNPIIRSAVNEIVNSLISIPLIAELYDPTAKAWEPLSPDDELSQILAAPSQSVEPAMWYSRYWTELVVLGNQYNLKQRNNMDGIRQLKHVDSRHMMPMGSDNEEIDHFRFAPSMWIGTGEAAVAALFLDRPDDQRFDREDIMFTAMSMDPTYPLMGLSPLASALRDIDLDNGITTFITSLMERGAVHDWALITKTPIDNAESRRIERRWFRRRAGPSNAGGLVVVDGTEADLKQLGMGIGPRDMGLMDLRKQVEARILMALNVPPIVVGSVIGIENATYSNYGQARMAMHEENSDPMLTRACSAFEWTFRGEFPAHRNRIVRVRADLSHVWALLESVDKRDRLAIAKMEASMLTNREARAAIDLPPMLDVDDFYLVPANYAAQAIIPGQSNVPVTSGDQSNNGNTNPRVGPATPEPAGEGERRTLSRAIATGHHSDVLRRLSARASKWGLHESEADFLAFEVLYKAKRNGDSERGTISERAQHYLTEIDARAERKL